VPNATPLSQQATVGGTVLLVLEEAASLALESSTTIASAANANARDVLAEVAGEHGIAQPTFFAQHRPNHEH